MNLTEIEIIQAIIECFGAMLCFTAGGFVCHGTEKSKRTNRLIYGMFLFTSLSLVFDAGAYVVRGNVSDIYININYAFNLAVFLCQCVDAYLLVNYIYDGLSNMNKKVSKVAAYISVAMISLATFIAISNIFSNWMFYIDADNYYHRAGMWYVFTGAHLVSLISMIILIIINFKNFELHTKRTIIICAVIPGVTVVLQIFIYGIALINFGLGFSILVLGIDRLITASHEKMKSGESDYEERNTMVAVICAGILVCCMASSVIISTITIQNVLSEEFQSDTRIVCNYVKDGIETKLLEPISVSKAMARDLMQRDAFLKGDKKNIPQDEEEIRDYLKSIKKGFGYSIVFAVSDFTKAYYTYNGVDKFMDENDKGDDWYWNFKHSGKGYQLSIDDDDTGEEDQIIYINEKVAMDSGTFLGVCGIGVSMNDMMAFLQDYEEQFDIRIELVDEYGLVQVSTSADRVHAATVSRESLPPKNEGEIFYENGGKVSTMITYMPDLDWYVIVVDRNPVKVNVTQLLMPVVVVFVIGIIIMILMIRFLVSRENQLYLDIKANREQSITDAMTGVLNRRAYEERMVAVRDVNRDDDQIVVVMDVNGLKNVNDNIGHDAGDELITGVAKCMKLAFSHLGKIYRTGGDEFVIFINGNLPDVMLATKKFDELTSLWQGKLVKEMSVSRGIATAADNPDCTLAELEKKADRLMYEDKSEYYRRTGKDRRRNG